MRASPTLSLFGVVVMLCGMAAHAVAATPSDYRFIREFGLAGTNVNQFNAMDGIAVDRFGHVFVTDTIPPDSAPSRQGVAATLSWATNMCVKRWSTAGTYELFWLNNELYPELPAAGIDCSCDGDPFYVAPAYVIAPYGSKIIHSDPLGTVYEKFPNWFSNTMGFYFRDVAVNANGDVYGILSAASWGTTSTVFTTYVTRYVWTGTEWSNAAAVSIAPFAKLGATAWGIEADAWRDRVYVSILAGTDGAGGIKVFDLNLNPVAAYDPWDYNASPLGVAVDHRDGSIFVCESVSNMIYKYGTDGTLLTSWGGPGATPSLFNRPSDLDVDMDGWVYVADADNHRVQVFAPPSSGNLNFIVDKANLVVRWKPRLKGKTNDTIAVRAITAIDAYTNITTLAGMPFSFRFGGVDIIAEMLPTKVNKKGTRAIYRPDKNHKMVVVFRPQGALLKLSGTLKKANIPAALGIADVAVQPPWLWVNAQMTLSNAYLGTHYLRMLNKNKVGKVYKAWKK